MHDTDPTKCSDLFLSDLYYSITMNIPTCYGLQGTIIRESKQSSTAQNQSVTFVHR